MADLNPHETAMECAYNAALGAVAQGCTRAETLRWISDAWTLSAADYRAVLEDALDAAEACGIEREDIDPSWFRPWPSVSPRFS